MPVKKLVNLHEEATQSRLRKACAHYGAHVYTKVRVADVLPVERGKLPADQFRFALQSHFDFVVTDESSLPLFAVEYDGPLHETSEAIARDRLKDGLCRKFEFPLLRIDAKYLPKRYRGQDLLSWLVRVYFCKRNHARAQSEGQIPLDEPFFPFAIISLGDEETPTMPFSLSAEALSAIRRHHAAGRCMHSFVGFLIGEDREGNWRGIGALRLDANSAVVSTVRMREQNFPVAINDLVGEILILKIHKTFEDVLKRKESAMPLNEAQEQVRDFARSYRIWEAAWIDPQTGETSLLAGAP